ncbi:hypothetical protein DdX_02799 [Ditylenchus destructor]|uniref:Uncharacterized protein n=1 Tax=Ditylenchus destructor TaxID=166010 RepID=A0AAD4NF40_9BILA|nr:hypothetical protein DdX_02799 [Ditylenchus destructor]
MITPEESRKILAEIFRNEEDKENSDEEVVAEDATNGEFREKLKHILTNTVEAKYTELDKWLIAFDYLQSEALERITPVVTTCLLTAYNSDTYTESFIDSFENRHILGRVSNADQNDWELTKDVIKSLLERVIAWKASSKGVLPEVYEEFVVPPLPRRRVQRLRLRVTITNYPGFQQDDENVRRNLGRLDINELNRCDGIITREDWGEIQSKRIQKYAQTFKPRVIEDDPYGFDDAEPEADVAVIDNHNSSFIAECNILEARTSTDVSGTSAEYENAQVRSSSRSHVGIPLGRLEARQKAASHIADLPHEGRISINRTVAQKRINSSKYRDQEQVKSPKKRVQYEYDEERPLSPPVRQIEPPEPARFLRSCLKKPTSFAAKKKCKIGFYEEVKYIEFEVEEVMAPCPGPQPFQTPSTDQFTTEEKTRNTTGLITNPNTWQLPHVDSLCPIKKRTNPDLLSKTKMAAHKREICVAYEDFCKKMAEYSDEVFRLNTLVTRLPFPKMPEWLLEAMNDECASEFPKEIQCIFIAYGFEIETLFSDDKSNIPFDFIMDLYTWLKNNAENTSYTYQKQLYNDERTVLEVTIDRRCPKIIAINVPEVGSYKRQFAAYNKRLKKYVDNLIEEEPESASYIGLLNWAELVNKHPDQKAMQTVEGRTRLLVEHMNKEYGEIYGNHKPEAVPLLPLEVQNFHLSLSKLNTGGFSIENDWPSGYNYEMCEAECMKNFDYSAVHPTYETNRYSNIQPSLKHPIKIFNVSSAEHSTDYVKIHARRVLSNRTLVIRTKNELTLTMAPEVIHFCSHLFFDRCYERIFMEVGFTSAFFKLCCDVKRKLERKITQIKSKLLCLDLNWAIVNHQYIQPPLFINLAIPATIYPQHCITLLKFVPFGVKTSKVMTFTPYIGTIMDYFFGLAVKNTTTECVFDSIQFDNTFFVLFLERFAKTPVHQIESIVPVVKFLTHPPAGNSIETWLESLSNCSRSLRSANLFEFIHQHCRSKVQISYGEVRDVRNNIKYLIELKVFV